MKHSMIRLIMTSAAAGHRGQNTLTPANFLQLRNNVAYEQT